MNQDCSKTLRLLLQLYLVRFRVGHESGPNETEVESFVSDHLADVGFCPNVNKDVCSVALGKDWDWALYPYKEDAT